MEYKLIRKKRKTLTIKISLEGEVLVYAPPKASIRSVENLLCDKAEWVAKTRARILDGLNQDRDKVPFLGRKYNLNIVEGCGKKTGIEFDGSQFHIYCKQSGSPEFRDEFKGVLYGWYKEKLLGLVTARIRELSNIMEVEPNKISIRAQKTIWGSCSYDNNISINLKLALAPLEIIDYILVHELCHIKHKNHSSEFWLAVESVMPDYHVKRRWLKENGFSLLLF
jgi:predicted metal-dependent hydrolase